MAGAAGSIASIARLGNTQHAHSLFKHSKGAAKAGHALGNQQQFATLLANRQAALQNSLSAGSTPGGTSNSASTSAATSATSATSTASAGTASVVQTAAAPEENGSLSLLAG